MALILHVLVNACGEMGLFFNRTILNFTCKLRKQAKQKVITLQIVFWIRALFLRNMKLADKESDTLVSPSENVSEVITASYSTQLWSHLHWNSSNENGVRD